MMWEKVREYLLRASIWQGQCLSYGHFGLSFAQGPGRSCCADLCLSALHGAHQNVTLAHLAAAVLEPRQRQPVQAHQHRLQI